MDYEERLLKAISLGYENYLSIHSRSNEKIKPIHGEISKILKELLGEGYEIKSLGFEENNEYTFNGKYYDKNIDITVLKNNIPLSGIGVKFVTSNYKQNSNNYFENMIGETANIRRNNIVYTQLIIFKHKLPYYSTDKKQFTKIETINSHDLKKYLNLELDNDTLIAHRPDLMCILLIDTGDIGEIENAINEKTLIKNRTEFSRDTLLPLVHITKTSDDEINKFDDITNEYLQTHSSFDDFLTAFVNLTKANEYGKFKK